MNKSKVALVRCQSYSYDIVLEAVQKGIDLLGGIDAFSKPGEKILLKPNVLIGSSPDSCICTHPSVFKAAGTLFKQSGATVYYGDSPAFGPSGINMMISGLKKTGDESGFIPAEFDTGRPVSHSKAILVKEFTIANGVLDCDGVISLPKFKTHGLTRFTGAIKNQFGCVPGLLKGSFHSRLPDIHDFSTMLVDLNVLIRPRLYIMDGIIAMEGNGPRNGKTREMNLILLSTDPVALDATACRIVNLDPVIVPTAMPGEKAGLGFYHSENIEITGEPLESFFTADFDIIRTPPVSIVERSKFRNFVKNRITDRPVIDKKLCTGCGTCIKMCPVEPKAVDWPHGENLGKPVHYYDRCIRCFCCQETCPEGAITIKRSFLSRLFIKIGSD